MLATVAGVAVWPLSEAVGLAIVAAGAVGVTLSLAHTENAYWRARYLQVTAAQKVSEHTTYLAEAARGFFVPRIESWIQDLARFSVSSASSGAGAVHVMHGRKLANRFRAVQRAWLADIAPHVGDVSAQGRHVITQLAESMDRASNRLDSLVHIAADSSDDVYEEAFDVPERRFGACQPIIKELNRRLDDVLSLSGVLASLLSRCAPEAQANEPHPLPGAYLDLMVTPGSQAEEGGRSRPAS